MLGAYILKESLGTLGKVGCAECLIGSVIIVLHAPPDKDIQTVDEILHYAVQPGISACAALWLSQANLENCSRLSLIHI